MSAVDRLTAAEVIAGHRYRPQDHCTIAYRSHCVCGWSQDLNNTHKTELTLHSEHVVAALEGELFDIVELPAPVDDAEDGPGWKVGDREWLFRNDIGGITDATGTDHTPTQARDLGLAYLAAARAAGDPND